MTGNEKVMISKCEVFNRLHPVDSNVVYIDDLGKQIETKVKHKANVLSGHTAVVWLEGVRGAYNLNRVIG